MLKVRKYTNGSKVVEAIQFMMSRDVSTSYRLLRFNR